MKLITKSTLFFLLFTLIAFGISLYLVVDEANKFNNISQRLVLNTFKENVRLTLEDEKSINVFNKVPYFQVYQLKDSSEVSQDFFNFQKKRRGPWHYAMRKDTLIFSEHRQKWKTFNKLTTYLKHDNLWYEVSVIVYPYHYKHFVEELSERIFLVFGILAGIVLIFNYFFMKNLWSPFDQILQRMKEFKIGSPREGPVMTKNGVKEFRELEAIFENMISKIESEFALQKEYTENMAHEVQTPLAIIRAKIEKLLSKEDVMDVAQDEVLAIYNEINQLSKLSTTLNLLTKIEHEEFKDLSVINIAELVENQVNNFKELAELKDIDIKIELDEKQRIESNTFLINILLKNLLKNALRYTDSGGQVMIQSNRNHFWISNSGSEPVANSETIFDRFSKHSKKGGESLGLGLAIVKNICDQNNWTIKYEFDVELKMHFFKITT
ncbi:sensor histidine kinase [Aureibacter tunicatorum]|uniref:histidine kinase n=1 Tax=Aureibacter tunicatorum TaxID=866807 RepID=A0AAE4BPI2_9BACT|nr:HAMP domain-containing sensor histidine kinase [Aureibacter tunicatorum]MDR6238014.1 signal transduction histidine kinase [Aureibacter tunicatorum]BDD03047.1 hypothetical protein AUTU_05300 [Aureibacter tunicatorum]